MKTLRIMRDWGCYPLWLKDPQDPMRDEVPENIDADELPISLELKEKINQYEKPIVSYYDAMEAIHGGGWSRHSKVELKTAIQKLGLTFPTPEEDQKLGLEIYNDLKNELSGKVYTFEFKDTLGAGILPEVQEALAS